MTDKHDDSDEFALAQWFPTSKSRKPKPVKPRRTRSDKGKKRELLVLTLIDLTEHRP